MNDANFRVSKNGGRQGDHGGVARLFCLAGILTCSLAKLSRGTTLFGLSRGPGCIWTTLLGTGSARVRPDVRRGSAARSRQLSVRLRRRSPNGLSRPIGPPVPGLPSDTTGNGRANPPGRIAPSSAHWSSRSKWERAWDRPHGHSAFVAPAGEAHVCRTGDRPMPGAVHFRFRLC